MHRVPRPSPSTAIALLALFVALGGTSYAMIGGAIPDSHGQFLGCVNRATGALRVVASARSCHVASGRGKHRKAGELAIAWSQTGPRGVQGLPGPATGAAGGDLAGSYPNPTIAAGKVTQAALAPGLNVSSSNSSTNSANLGGTPAGSYIQFGSTLPSGQSESGDYGIDGYEPTGPGDSFVTGLRFYPPLAAALNSSHVTFAVNTTTTACPGYGQAAPGNLCVYGYSTTNIAGAHITNYGNGYGADRWGAELVVTGAGVGQVQSYGTWTVTAP